MLGKRFHDILSIAFILLLFASGFLLNQIFKDPLESGTIDPFEAERLPSFAKVFLYSNIIGLVLAGVYAIFIIILAIQMYSRKLVSIGDTIFIVLFFPLDIVFYFLTLRKHYKEIDNAPPATQAQPEKPAAPAVVQTTPPQEPQNSTATTTV